MSKEKFIKDLMFGNKGEEVVLNHILSMADNAALIDICNNGDYDLKVEINGEIKTFEVKTEDKYCKAGNNTGNIFVETMCNGKPSGITRSIADWYVFYMPFYKKLWYIKSDDLKLLIKENNFPLKENSGDGGLVVGYAVPRKKVEQFFKIYEI